MLSLYLVFETTYAAEHKDNDMESYWIRIVYKICLMRTKSLAVLTCVCVCDPVCWFVVSLWRM